MESFSYWRLNTEQNYQDIIDNLLNYEDWLTRQYDTIGNRRELEFTIEVDRDEDYVLQIDDEIRVQFAYVFHRWERIVNTERDNPDDTKRIKQLELDFYVFEYANQVFFVALKGQTPHTLTALRSANNFTGRLEIVENPLSITDDFFYWLFNQYMNFEDEELYTGTNSYVSALTAYRGGTENEHDTWGRGNRITRILVTLAFLFHTDNFKSLTPEFKVDDNTLVVELTTTGNYKVEIARHLGEFFLLEERMKKGSLLIYFYITMFPRIYRAYDLHIRDHTWSPQMKLNFLANIGSEIQDRVREQQDAIRAQLEAEEN
ncbi:hypothetical protein [Bacillus paranthracis]|uniref:hypothetical protein n=1 Tax=Bacillus paranthracis TaxID=2026186 RepID=UPI0022E7EFB1|nr:hypothetical protein [Bacillus paranthracis]